MEGRRGEEKWKDVVKKRRQERKEVMEGAKEERKKSCFCKLNSWCRARSNKGGREVERGWARGGSEDETEHRGG